ncbi:MAG: prepilin-type N-terminal cleavage/methylation domain-containing protein, partial [Pseudomonadales bacterium]|nr:prepilin-type N-terminal cleavage/methylation domain-containing protein [Pseudomonadales bacterium]
MVVGLQPRPWQRRHPCIPAGLTILGMRSCRALRHCNQPQEILSMKTVQKGFTLIELLVVIAII